VRLFLIVRTVGIPLIAYQEAKRLNLVTVGFACQAAKKEKTFDCDEVHIVGNDWGDESASFLSFCDGLVQIGGVR
jgi:hypothetical protein